MKHMKKILAVALVVVMTLCFSSCDMADVADFVVENFLSVDVAPSHIDGDTYINNELDLYFVKPATWDYMTEEEIADTMVQGVTEYFGDYAELILSLVNPSTYDMMAVDPHTGCNVMVGYENLKRSFKTGITEEEYLRNLESGMGIAEGMSMSFSDEFDTVTLGNLECTRAICSVYTNGIKLTQAYYAHKCDGYMAFVIITVRSGYTLPEIEAMFR